jgi:ribonuclease HI
MADEPTEVLMRDGTRMPTAKIYTDGACKGNPGCGGWAWSMTRDGVTSEASGSVPTTTNNKMELQAAIEALSTLKEPTHVAITSDSEYLVNGITKWINAWKLSDWHISKQKLVANRDQWEALDLLCQRHRVQWSWVRGHSGDPGNERCDFLANEQAGIKDGDEWWRRCRIEKRPRRHKPSDTSTSGASHGNGGGLRAGTGHPSEDSGASQPVAWDVFTVIDEATAS